MSPTLQIVLAGGGTFLIRYSAVGMASRGVRYPPAVEATLRLVAPAVLAAIAANALVVDDGTVSTRWSWYGAAILAGLVSWRWKSAGLSMLAGMVGLWSVIALT